LKGGFSISDRSLVACFFLDLSSAISLSAPGIPPKDHKKRIRKIHFSRFPSLSVLHEALWKIRLSASIMLNAPGKNSAKGEISVERMLHEAVDAGRRVLDKGSVATYIPELAKADPNALAVAFCGVDGARASSGDTGTRITIQSISKVASLGLALSLLGEDLVFSRVGVEPSADPFNSIMRLEMRAPHRPQNPLINSGAILILSLLPFSDSSERLEAVLEIIRKMTGNPGLRVNESVAVSERDTSDRNRSLGYFLRSMGTMEGNVENILDSYFRQCAIECTVEDLAVMGATLAAGGSNPLTGEKVLPEKATVIIRALMTTCGLYDGSGDFAVRVGFPAKSGVGGGITGSIPGRAGLAVVGPALDPKGNSIGGVRVLEHLSGSMSLRVL